MFNYPLKNNNKYIEKNNFKSLDNYKINEEEGLDN